MQTSSGDRAEQQGKRRAQLGQRERRGGPANSNATLPKPKARWALAHAVAAMASLRVAACAGYARPMRVATRCPLRQHLPCVASEIGRSDAGPHICGRRPAHGTDVVHPTFGANRSEVALAAHARPPSIAHFRPTTLRCRRQSVETVRTAARAFIPRGRRALASADLLKLRRARPREIAIACCNRMVPRWVEHPARNRRGGGRLRAQPLHDGARGKNILAGLEGLHRRMLENAGCVAERRLRNGHESSARRSRHGLVQIQPHHRRLRLTVQLATGNGRRSNRQESSPRRGSRIRDAARRHSARRRFQAHIHARVPS